MCATSPEVLTSVFELTVGTKQTDVRGVTGNAASIGEGNEIR